MVDPRVIRPSPQGIFSDGTESLETEADQTPPGEEVSSEEDIRGMVDPRSEAAGPDI